MSETASRYRILSSLGKGGMGEVFLADDTQLGRKVAIKFLTEALEEDPTARDRLHREARSAAALDHPYICQIHELADIDGRTGIVMEHVAGETLQVRLRRSPLAAKEALQIAAEIAEALEEAHSRRVVHRDLKPSNVMLTEQGHVKVMDFGLAKRAPSSSGSGADAETVAPITESGVRVGTPGYMAPEQLLGGEADERSDIFAFGILLYELLAGVHPFTRSSASGTMSAISRETPAPVTQYAKDAPDSARVTLDRLLAKDPRERYQAFSDVRTDLDQLLRDASGLTLFPQTTPAAAPASTGRTALVGRESELAQARQLLDQTVAGHGTVLLLGGEPGVGKTRLAEEVLAEGRQRGCLALIGRCYEMEGTPPFIPWVELVERSGSIVPRAAFREALGDAAPEVAKLVPELRQMFPDIPQPIELPPEQQQRYLFSNFLSFVKRGTRVTPQVLLLDDLHWADDSTLLLLLHVAQHTSEIPLLIVGTYRDVDLDVTRPFAKMLEAFTRQRLAHKVALRRLPETGVGEMLEALSGEPPPDHLVAAIFAETEGNPFFVEEVFQHLSEEGRLFDADGRWRADLRVEDLEVPEGIRLVIGRRVERLSPEARKVLMTAAVVGRTFDVGLLEALGDAEGDALLTAIEEAETAKLILTVSAGRQVRWEFTHGLIRQTLEHSLSLMRRQRTHLRVAEAMERVYGDRVERHASDVAQHLYQAGVAADPGKTERFLTLAGGQALAAGAFDEALRQYTDALAVQEETEDRHKVAELQYKKGLVLRSLGRPGDAVDEWRPALAAYDELQDLEGIARTVSEMADQTSWLPGQTHAALDISRRGLDSVGDGDAGARCRMLALVARFSGLAGDPCEVARDPLVEAEALAADLDRPELTAELLTARTRFHWSYMQLPQAIEVGRRAAVLRRERGELFDVAELYWQVEWSMYFCGRLREADELARELSTLAAGVGHVNARGLTRLMQTRHHLVTTGDLTESAERGRRDIEWSEQNAPTWRCYDHSGRGDARFFAGDWAAARADYDTAEELEPRSFMNGHHRSIVLVAGAYAGDDVLDRLQAERTRALRLADDNPFGLWELLVNVVEGLAVLGRKQDVADLHALVVKGIDKRGGCGISWHIRLWQMVAGIAASCGEQWDTAHEHFETALRQAHELPHKIAQPKTRRWYAQMLIDRNGPGDRDKAQTLLGEAVEMYRTIGMPKHLEMAERMLKEL